ncbi:hypothetical protein [Acidovorax sp. SUPP2825]|uniref:hypothetical protein n=1 Tax=Acidovorax sp. SUPP2825 TaxID=2920879 RepID=UPI0023DE69AB|nr:hypothetical protein [Acidovorax sp. SUPP2825]GKS96568.1 hypothetical protein AVAK2825_18555 [Acidovorax sp. SUPP2825]
MKYGKRAKILFCSVLCLIPAYALFLIFAWSAFDVADVSRNSAMYHFAVPAHLRSVDLVLECRSPSYRWKGWDGAGVPFSSLNYGSSASTADLFKIYRSKFMQQSCRTEILTLPAESEQLLRMGCTNEDFLEVKIFVTEKGGCNNVTVDFLDND